MEEIRLWSQSFDKLMKNPAGRNVFREFLRTEYSEENMLFWLACEDLKKEINKNAIEEKARSIYEDYISILSPKEVAELSADSSISQTLNLSNTSVKLNIQSNRHRSLLVPWDCFQTVFRDADSRLVSLFKFQKIMTR